MADSALPDDDIDPSAFKPRGQGGFSLGLTVMALGLAGYLLFGLWGELGYWIGAPARVDLGSPGAYSMDRLREDVVATIQGVPGPVANRYTRMFESWEIVSVRGTAVLVRRAPPRNEPPLPVGKAPPPPEQKPFTATGRLLRDTSIPQYEHAFRTLAERGEASPHQGHLWVLLDGDLPRSGWKVPTALAVALFFVGFNAYSLVRYLRRKRA